MSLRFGTDGVRGVAGTELTPELVLALGRAAARVLCDGTAGVGPPRLVLARDTRRSGPLLEAAFAAGVAAEGVDVELLGVLPTPGLARVAAAEGVVAAMVSASHNPYADNGIKLFAAGGAKLDASAERRLEAVLDRIRAAGHGDGRRGDQLGTVTEREAAGAAYVDALVAVLPPRCLDGIVIVVDCANGAASAVAPAVLSRLGAWVEVIAAEPDGTNINEACGSTHPEALQEAVVRLGADIGLALDGDADRVLAVDGEGVLVDGDQLLALFADDLRARGLLRHDTVALTVMSNLGLRLALDERGIAVVETPVGDRHVLEAMQAGELSLGGEQSGHIVFADHGTTGDGTFTGVALAELVARSGRTLADLAGASMVRLPQVLRNVTVADRAGLDDAGPVWDAVADVEAALGSTGRVLLRPSGTEPLVRVMVEAPTEATASAPADRLVAVVAATLG